MQSIEAESEVHQAPHRDDPDAQHEASGDRQSNEIYAVSFKNHFRGLFNYHGTIGYDFREDEFLYNTLHAIDKNKDGELSIAEYEAFVDLMLNLSLRFGAKSCLGNSQYHLSL